MHHKTLPYTASHTSHASQCIALPLLRPTTLPHTPPLPHNVSQVGKDTSAVRCMCDLYCSPPPHYEPVCGSDLEFYESECHMRFHACNVQVELYLLSVEDCAGAFPLLQSCADLSQITLDWHSKFDVKYLLKL